MAKDLVRVVFDFDQGAFDTLEKMRKQAGVPDYATIIRQSLQIDLALKQQSRKGYTEVLVRNPETGEERYLTR